MLFIIIDNNNYLFEDSSYDNQIYLLMVYDGDFVFCSL